MDVSNLCRSCMRELALWEKNFDRKIVEMFTYCTNIEVSDDQLPRQFCDKCTATLETCCGFITTARAVDMRLKDMISTVIKFETPDPHFDVQELGIKADDASGFDNDAPENKDALRLANIKVEIKLDSGDRKRKRNANKACKKSRKNLVGTNNNFQVTSVGKRRNKKVRAKCIKREPKECRPKHKSDLQCPFCNKVFLKKRLSFKRHILEHFEHAKATEPNEETTEMLADEKPLHSHKQQSYMCAVCNRGYARKRNLEKHMSMSHSNIVSPTEEDTVERNICSMCEKRFLFKTDLLQHLTVAHLRYPCRHCPLTFASSPELQRHKVVEHRGRRFDCPHCSQHFPKRQLYTEHVRAHNLGAGLRNTCGTGLEPRYTCDYCSKSFHFKSDLRLHLHIHDDTLKSVLCDFCGSRFSHRQALLDHRRVHTGEKPFACAQCSYRSAFASNMRRHARAHQSERRHQCVQCGKAFNEANSLKKHMYWHTGERPYQCPHCERRYMNSTKRKNHMVRAHGLDPLAIPRLAMDGGPARRYVTDDTKPRPPYSLLAQRTTAQPTRDHLPDT